MAPARSANSAYDPEKNLLLPIPGVGRFSPADFTFPREYLSHYPGGPTDPEQMWIGWRFSELPLLYRDRVRKLWEYTYRKRDDTSAPSLAGDDTFVLWGKAIMVTVGVNAPDGGGGGVEFILPAL